MSTFVRPADATPVTLARSSQLNNLASAVETAFGLLPDESKLSADTVAYGACTATGTNAYVVTLTSSQSVYIDGMLLCFKAITSNTGACTVNVVTSSGSLGVKSLKRHAGGDLAAGDITAGQFYNFRYNTSTGNFELQQAALSEVTGGTSITVTSSLSDDPAPTLSANLKVGTYSLADSSDNEFVKFNPTGSAVNEFTIRNAATLTGPRLEASGSDTNIDIVFVPKGSGAINLEDKPLKRARMINYSEVVTTVSSSAGTLTLDLETGNQFIVTLTENVTTLSIPTFPVSAAGSATIYLTQAASAKTVAWDTLSVLWDSGVAPDITTNNSKHVIVIWSPDGGTTVYGSHSIKNAAEPA